MKLKMYIHGVKKKKHVSKNKETLSLGMRRYRGVGV